MFRRGVTLALALLLVACGGSQDRDPFTDSRIPPSLGPRDWPPPGWTWGLIQVGEAPPQRYGVAAPDAPPRAQVLILPGYGAAAEDEYHLADALIDHGDAVWVLDGAGQGGSGRLLSSRDLGHLTSFDGDLTAIEQMIALVIRPQPGTPLIVVADTTSSLLALRRMQLGAPGIAGLALRAPTRAAPDGARSDGPIASGALRLGLTTLRAPGTGGWSRDGPEIDSGLDGQTAHAWRLANPDLRMGGPSLGWMTAFAKLTADLDTARFSLISTPTLILRHPTATAADLDWSDRLCRALPRCVQSGAPTQTAEEAQIAAFADTLRQAADGPLARAAQARPSQAGRSPLALTHRRLRRPGRPLIHAASL